MAIKSKQTAQSKAKSAQPTPKKIKIAPVEIVAPVESEEEEEESDDGSEGSDESDDVTEEALERMMELLGSDADLGSDEGSEDGSDLLSGEEEEMNELSGEDNHLGEIAEKGFDDEEDSDDDEDEEEGEDEDEEVEYEALSDVDDADVIPTEKTTVNDKTALLRILATIKHNSTNFFDTLTLTSDEKLDIPDASDDLNRELQFYKSSLSAALSASTLFASASLPFFRPADYFAEMLKSDSHMAQIRQKLVDEQAGIKASEDARKLRDMKKFGKKVQVQKVLERGREKKALGERVGELKKKRKNGESLSTDDFDIALEDAISGSSKKKPKIVESQRGAARGRGSRGISRDGRNSKFGNPTTSRRPKENNDKVDFKGEDERGFKRGRSGPGGGRGGRGGRGGARGGSSRGGGGEKKRLGKSRRN